MSNTKILTAQTCDSTDCTATGTIITAYTDGRVALESYSRWSGSRSGERWTSEPGEVDPAAVSASTLREIGLAHEERLYETCSPLPSYRQTAKGWTV